MGAWISITNPTEFKGSSTGAIVSNATFSLVTMEAFHNVGRLQIHQKKSRYAR